MTTRPSHSSHPSIHLSANSRFPLLLVKKPEQRPQFHTAFHLLTAHTRSLPQLVPTHAPTQLVSIYQSHSNPFPKLSFPSRFPIRSRRSPHAPLLPGTRPVIPCPTPTLTACLPASYYPPFTISTLEHRFPFIHNSVFQIRLPPCPAPPVDAISALPSHHLPFLRHESSSPCAC